MSTERQDIHRPSAIKPEDYNFVCFGQQKITSFGDCAVVLANRRILEEFQQRTGATFATHEHGGNCDICGSVNMIYSVIYHHIPTNTLIRCGQDCAQKLDLSLDFASMNRFRAAINDAREAHAGKRKAAALLADHDLAHLWDIFTAEYDSLPKDPRTVVAPRVEKTIHGDEMMTEGFAGSLYSQESKVRDIVGKLVKWGSISDKTWDYLQVLSRQIAERPIRIAKRQAEEALIPVIVEGRYEISGEVLKGEWRDSQWGGSYKITVKNAAGQVFWGTSPSSLGDPKRGDKVSFVATVEKTDRPSFAFFKRPHVKAVPQVDEVAAVRSQFGEPESKPAEPAVAVESKEEVAVA